VLKVCSKCKESKSLDCFSDCKNAVDGKQWNCKECKRAYKQQHKDYIAEHQKKYRQQNVAIIESKRKIRYQNESSRIKEKRKEYYIKNKILIAEKHRLHRESNPEKTKETTQRYRTRNREKILIANKEYRQKNKDKIKEYQSKPEVIARRRANKLKNKQKINANKRYKEKLRRNIDPTYKLITNQRTRITGILKKHKTSKTLDLLGCSAQFLRQYIEDQFLEGMTWDNYGTYGWHVDHITPCSSFDLTDIKQQKICFHYTNLQPLWAIDNLKKSNKIITG
jgi:hypothetical protein